VQYRSKSLADTERLGKALAQSLLKSALPCISLFQGPFGSGKTTLIKVLISEIASIRQESIASPTFQYVTLYQGKKNLSIAHFDLWRLPSPESFYSLGLEDIVDSSLSFIEWPEKLGSLCPEASLIIRINAPQEEERMFEIEDRRHLLDTCSLEFS
jgi:tRNA threonylcarbamoyladenosine biosynthesis protein TsaE